MKSSITRIAQAVPEAAPAPPPAAAAPMPDPLGGMASPMDMGMPVAPMTGTSTAPVTGSEPKILKTPLESSGMILLDAEVEKRLKEQFSTSAINSTSEQTIANEIWKEYGGNELGGVDPEKRGKRKKDTEVDEEEIKRTRDRKWERLPEGKNLEDLGIELEALIEMVFAWSQGIAAAKKKESPGGAGGGMGLASRQYKKLIKTAQILDNLGQYKLADKLF